MIGAITQMSNDEEKRMEPQFISIDNAAAEQGVKRTTMYYYIKQLGIMTRKFPMDRKTYITIADLGKIREAKRMAEEGRR